MEPGNQTYSRGRRFAAAAALVVAVALWAWLYTENLSEPQTARKAPAPRVAGEPTPTAHVARTKSVLFSRFAGSWYEAGTDKLTAELEAYFEKADLAPPGPIHALILPHAGYQYSGQTAAYGAKLVAGRAFSRVIVIGPSHSVPMENVASLPSVTHYATPLGEIPLDLAFIDALKRHSCFQTIPHAHQREHSVQMEVPMLQHALGTFPFVPIVVGDLDLDCVRKMAAILLGLMDPNTLVVVSSDFTHYGPNFNYIPFRKDVPGNLEALDRGAFERIEAKDLEGFRDYVREKSATICGRNPIKVLLAMLSETSKAHWLKYDTSGRITGDYLNSVSYLSIAFTGAWKTGKPITPDMLETGFTEHDKETLLKLARGTLEYALERQAVPTPEDLGIELSPRMEAARGAFVTLHKNGMLRGCIGDIFPTRPLYKSIIQNALNAGLNDRRFAPLRQEELPELHLEISALTPPTPIASLEEIVVGTHGVVLEKNGRSAVFLPQVAPEQGWTREEMLERLAIKAGLPPDAWKEGASFTVFEADVFGEDKE